MTFDLVEAILENSKKNRRRVATEAYQEGQRAFGDGAYIWDCPYPLKSGKRAFWVRGWQQAEFEEHDDWGIVAECLQDAHEERIG